MKHTGDSDSNIARTSNSNDSRNNTRLTRALMEYLVALEAGQRPQRDAILNEYADIDSELVECLESIDFIHDVSPHFAMSSDDSRNAIDQQRSETSPKSLGDFCLQRELGRGGMGIVYEAGQISIGRRVALKILPFAALLNQNQLERFNTEATAAARLQHPGIVQVYSVGCERGIHYYAMQLIDGPSLAEVISEMQGDRNPNQETEDTVVAKRADLLTRDEDGGHYRAVARIGREAAEALHHAHENGVLHRDIKPSNLLLDKSGHVWITDFGLARVEDESQLTRTGDVLGTLHYMSPEQATGERVDCKSDVYSLGATLHELATLKPVFDSEDRRDTMKKVIAGNPIASHTVDCRIPQPLSLVISRAMARRLEDRYESAQEMADDLQRFLDGEPVSAKPPTFLRRSRAWARRHRLASAAIVSLLILVLLLPIFTHHFFPRVPDDSPTKGSDMNVLKAATVAAAAAAMAMATAGVNAKKPPKPPPADEVPAPTGLVVRAATEDSITLEWTSGGGTTAGFIVAYLEGTKYPRPNLRGATVIEGITQETHMEPDLKTDQVYSFRVCAVDSNGNRSEGVTVQEATLSAPPDLYEVFDYYAEFVDNSTFLGAGAFTVQPDGRLIITAEAAPNGDGRLLGQGGEHFVGRLNPDGSVDTSFNNGVGYHRMDILDDGDTTRDFPHNPIVLSDGKIIVGGTLGDAPTEEGWQTTEWYLAQYTADGSLDVDNFGEGGIVVDTMADVSIATGWNIRVRPDCKIVAAGCVAMVDAPHVRKGMVVQYNSDGTRDTTFGLNGGMTSFLPPGASSFFVAQGMPHSVAILSDGRIAVAGWCYGFGGGGVSMVVMFNSDGTVDASFGEGGFAYVDTLPDSEAQGDGGEGFYGIVEQPDGRLLAFGSRSGLLDDGTHFWWYQRTMARFHADGSVDTSFGTNGMVIPQKDSDYSAEDYRAVSFQSDQKIVVFGLATETDMVGVNQTDIFVERFNVDGSRDMSFDGTGRIELWTPGTEFAHGIQVLGDDNVFDLPRDSIVIGGTHKDGGWEQQALSTGLLLYLVPLP